MGWTHDSINGFYYEDREGKRLSPTEYYRKQVEKEKLRQGQQYILIKICEGKIKGEETYCDLHK